MKKYFLLIFSIFIISLSANANSYSYYEKQMPCRYSAQKTHQAIYAKPKKCCAKTRSAYRYANNKEIIAYRTEQRKHRLRTTPTNHYTQTQNHNQISRFDKNYNISKSNQKRVSSGGITYYGIANHR